MNLVEKIEKVEALLKGAKTAGERQAAQRARMRLLKKNANNPIEYSVRVDSPWKKRLFVALCAKHNLSAYRYKRQKHTTSMVMVSKYFMDEVLWPEFKKYAKIFEELANDILGDLISQIHETSEEVIISGELPQKNTLQV